MIKRIVSIFVCMLLIATIFLLTATAEDENNKWAILCAGASEPDIPSTYVYQDYLDLKDILVNHFGFPEIHIFGLVNESFTLSNINNSFATIKANSTKWEEATIVVWMSTHGGSDDWTLPPMRSWIFIYKENTGPPGPDGCHGYDNLTRFYNYQLDKLLDGWTTSSQKVLVAISACRAGCFAANDVTGVLHGLSDRFFDSTFWSRFTRAEAGASCGGKGRIIITASTARTTSPAYWQLRWFWKEGLVQGKGDTFPIFGNHDGTTSVEEAWFYYKRQTIFSPDLGIRVIVPCMNDQFPAKNPRFEMFL